MPIQHLIMKKLDEINWVLSELDKGIWGKSQLPTYGGFVEQMLIWN